MKSLISYFGRIRIAQVLPAVGVIICVFVLHSFRSALLLGASSFSSTWSSGEPWRQVTSLQRPTFSGEHDFASLGPRRRFQAGASRKELLRNQPSMSNNQPREEESSPQFVESANYYAAAWLSSMDTFLKNKNFHLEKIHENKQNKDPWLEWGTFMGLVGQTTFRTLDMFDFFVHHLSIIKGYSGVFINQGGDPVHWIRYLENLRTMQHGYEQLPYNNPSGERNGNVLVITPFHAATDGHSRYDEKNLYLNITVKTLARVFPNIVVTVADEDNYNYVANESDLNRYLFDILLLKDLNKTVHLPAMSNIYTREAIREGRYVGFDWIYYTEADQIPHLRNVNLLLKQTLRDTNTVVVPHRSNPVLLPNDLNASAAPIREGLAKHWNNLKGKDVHDVPDIRSKRCCFIPSDMEYTVPIRNASVKIFRQYDSAAQVAGTCNVFTQACNICNLSDTRRPCEQ